MGGRCRELENCQEVEGCYVVFRVSVTSLLTYYTRNHFESRDRADRETQVKVFSDRSLSQDVRKALDKSPLDSVLPTSPVSANQRIVVVSKDEDGKAELDAVHQRRDLALK